VNGFGFGRHPQRAGHHLQASFDRFCSVQKGFSGSEDEDSPKQQLLIGQRLSDAQDTTFRQVKVMNL
jgi:hypothetical protein